MKSDIIREIVHLVAEFSRGERIAFAGFKFCDLAVHGANCPAAGIRTIVIAGSINRFGSNRIGCDE